MRTVRHAYTSEWRIAKPRAWFRQAYTPELRMENGEAPRMLLIER